MEESHTNTKRCKSLHKQYSFHAVQILSFSLMERDSETARDLKDLPEVTHSF